MKLVQHLLKTKSAETISTTAEASVLDAIKLMAERAVGSLPVMRDSELIGIVTERDYARKVIIKGRSSQSTAVGEIMTADVVTVGLEKTVNDCMELMSARKIRHLPVLDGDKLIGIISIGDLVQAIISDQKEEIEHLEHYISGQ